MECHINLLGVTATSSLATGKDTHEHASNPVTQSNTKILTNSHVDRNQYETKL